MQKSGDYLARALFMRDGELGGLEHVVADAYPLAIGFAHCRTCELHREIGQFARRQIVGQAEQGRKQSIDVGIGALEMPQAGGTLKGRSAMQQAAIIHDYHVAWVQTEAISEIRLGDTGREPISCRAPGRTDGGIVIENPVE